MLQSFKGIELRALQNAAHMEFVNTVTEEVGKLAALSGADAGRLAVERLKAARNAEDENFKMSQKSDYTAEIAAADKERDMNYSAFKKVVDAYRRFPSGAQAEAAGRIWELIRLYKINVNMRLDNETALIDNLLQDLNSKHREDIQRLNILPMVQEMDDANARVRELVQSRTTESASRVAGALKTARGESDAALRNVLLAVTSMAFVFGEEAYVEFAKFYNALVDRYRKQLPKGASSEEETEETEAEE